jgi:hypothetical protein
MNSLFWLWDFILQYNPVGFIWNLIFPQPVADSTLPPYYIPSPDVVLPPEGGQCPVKYNVTIRVWQYNATDTVVSVQTHVGYNIQGPLLKFTTKEVSSSAHHFGVETLSGFVMIWGVSVNQPNVSMELRQYEVIYFYNSSGSRVRGERYVYRVEAITRVDGLPDDCGSIPPPPEIKERLIPVYRPVPLPNPFPPVVPPRAPVPIPVPPIPRLPPSLPLPPRTILPPIGIDIDVNLNFDFSTNNINIEIDCENGIGTFPTEPFQNLAKLLYAILYEVRELREVTDRIAKQVDCLAEKFCRESKGLYNLPLGKVGYFKRSLFTFARPANEKLEPVGIQILLPEIQVGAGRRARKFAPNLYSEKALGYYAFQFESGGFGELGEIRFSQSYIPIPERAIAIAFWLEPQAGEGFLYCWYEKIHYQEE